MPDTAVMSDTLTYMSGFGNEFETEALPGVLPQGQNTPRRNPYGLYAEQVSGSPFTAPNPENQRSWLYRIRPSVRHMGRYRKIDLPYWTAAVAGEAEELPLGQVRWKPPALPEEGLGFAEGVRIMVHCGSLLGQHGMSAGYFFLTEAREREAMMNADGELLLIPQSGAILVKTELGNLKAGLGEIVAIPRGLVFNVLPLDGPVLGYLCENHGAPFVLPERGPIGANCLANPRDFKTPVAAFEDEEAPHRMIAKWCGRHYAAEIPASPFDVVGWHGNYAPYKYDLRHFCPVNAVLFDHPDPSIFTVLTSPTPVPGTANIDFVIFPDRWNVAENTFRPPWYHRNVMSELMGMLYGVYDAKPGGFKPGGMSIHNLMLPHGPDAQAFEAASNDSGEPFRQKNTMAFMLETRMPQLLTAYAAQSPNIDADYPEVWSGLKKRFNGTPEGDWS